MADLIGMNFTLKLNEPLDPSKHYLSPGGFVINGKCFDFTSSYVGKGNSDCEISVEMSDYDYATAQEEEDWLPITKEDAKTGVFSEFFIYNGESGEENVFVTEVSGLSFVFDDGEEIFAGKETLESANNALVNNVEMDKGERDV